MSTVPPHSPSRTLLLNHITSYSNSFRLQTEGSPACSWDLQSLVHSDLRGPTEPSSQCLQPLSAQIPPPPRPGRNTGGGGQQELPGISERPRDLSTEHSTSVRCLAGKSKNGKQSVPHGGETNSFYFVYLLFLGVPVKVVFLVFFPPKVYNLLAFNTFTRLSNHQHYVNPEGGDRTLKVTADLKCARRGLFLEFLSRWAVHLSKDTYLIVRKYI